MMSWSKAAAAAVAALALSGLPHADALAADAVAGGKLVQQWCVSCHATGSGRANDAAPPLAAIAQARGGNQGWVRAWLANPHPPMPNLNLSNREIDDIVAYLATLRG